jgi:hypothetical protein
MCVPRIFSSVWQKVFDCARARGPDWPPDEQVILAARIRNMSESKPMLWPIEKVATALKPTSSGVGGIMSMAGTTLRHRRKPPFLADIFLFFCLSIVRRLPRWLCEHASRRTRHGERGMTDTDHFLTGIAFTSAVNGSIEEH